MRRCGHRTRAVFDRHAIVTEETLRAGVEKLARLHGTAPTAERAVLPLAKWAEG
ncbi:MAG: hypothetical protein HY704_05285 [Gemmatimonadetes bacterium]|nr:hypothetical protein [Gemmatimonadota bacterium]